MSRASDEFREKNPGRELKGNVSVDEIKVGDSFYVEGVVEKIRETKLYRFLTVYDGAAGQTRRELRFKKGQNIYVP